ncbi:MAG: hypothetical protein K2X27_09980 [Candidatus Obscuribacterales bacterium]|nr:hypothetical protein [Candidatus Obscuribacterales bacterium]
MFQSGLKNLPLLAATLSLTLWQPGIAYASAESTYLPAEGASSPKEEVNLKGIVSVYEGPSPDPMVGGLVSLALQRDAATESLEKKDKQMKGVVNKALSAAKMSAHFITEYRGFEMSSEGADIILDEKLKLKSASATDYAKQRKADEAHAKVVSSLLQIAQGLGMNDEDARKRTIQGGLEPLSQMVGAENANLTLKNMEAWSAQLNVPASIFKKDPWTMMELQQKSEGLLKSSAQTDPVMGLVRRALHKYNGHSKFALGAAKAINTTLSVAMFTPTIVSPIAQIMSFVYQMATGGPEDYKLLSELYLDKRLECRWKRLNQESGQAINAYNNAIMTKNPVLLGFSENLISALGGEESSSKILGNNRLVARRSTHNDAIDCLQTHNTM